MGEASTREYNGSSWSDGGDMEASMSSMIIAGTLTSAIYFGGYEDTPGVASYSSRSETYNGTTWSDAASMRHNMSGTGTGRSTTDAIMCSGSITAGGSETGVSEELDGTTWSAGGTCNTATTAGGSAGGITDCIKMSGYSFPGSDETGVAETYNGTSWTAVTSNGVQTRYNTGWGDGSTKAWCVGGIDYQSPYGSPNPHIVNRTPEYWNGSSWATDTDTPSAGGTSGGKYNLNIQGGTTGNSGTQGAMVCLGYNYSGGSTSAKQDSNWEATW